MTDVIRGSVQAERQHIRQQNLGNDNFKLRDILKPHFLYLSATLFVYAMSIFIPTWNDATLYHLDFKKVFSQLEIWRLFTCLLVAGQFLGFFNVSSWVSSFMSPMQSISGFLPFLVLQSGWLHLWLCYTHLKRLWISATSSNRTRDFFFQLGFVVGSIWLIKFLSGTFLEDRTYQRLQSNKSQSFDGLFSVLSSIINDASYTRALQYHISIFPAYFMFTMAIVTLSSYKTPNAILDLRFTQMHYWALPFLLIAAQFIATINSPLRNTLLINNLIGLGIARSYKAITEYQPIRQKINHTLGTHLD